MRHRSTWRVVAGVVLLAGLTVGAWAAPAAAGEVDQAQETYVSEMGGSGPFDVAQTFTPAVSGHLDRVDLAIARRSGTAVQDFVVEIRNLDAAGRPDDANPPLARRVVGASAFPIRSGAGPIPLTAIHFTPVGLSAGKTYAVFVHSPDRYLVGTDGRQDLYPRGQLLARDSNDNEPPGAWYTPGHADAVFRTYMGAAPPAPCPTGLLSGLLCSLGLRPLADALAGLGL